MRNLTPIYYPIEFLMITAVFLCVICRRTSICNFAKLKKRLLTAVAEVQLPALDAEIVQDMAKFFS